MKLSLFDIEILALDSIFGVGLLTFEPIESNSRSLFSLWWCDRECFLSVLYFNFDWVCLIGWKEETE